MGMSINHIFNIWQGRANGRAGGEEEKQKLLFERDNFYFNRSRFVIQSHSLHYIYYINILICYTIVIYLMSYELRNTLIVVF